MPIILPANTITGGYEVANSLRFDDGSSDYLSRTNGTPTDVQKYTFSAWVKRAGLGARQRIITGLDPASTGEYSFVEFTSGDLLGINNYDGTSGSGIEKATNRVFRDTSAWYHIVVAVDSTQATATDRLKIYVNGVQETSFNYENPGAQNQDLALVKSGKNVYVGQHGTVGMYFDGYMSEVVLIDGQVLDETSFGEFDTDSGIWKPIDVSGLTFGTNGFYLDFENSGSLGADVSGNGNNFTVNNLTSIDQTTDTPTNNFATLNPLALPGQTSSFSNGNLKAQTATNAASNQISTLAVSSGKYYWEIKCDAISSDEDPFQFGIMKVDNYPTSQKFAFTSAGYAYWGFTGQKYNNNTLSSYGDPYAVGDIIGIALDLDNNYLYFSKNGTFQNSGDPTSGSSGTGAAFNIDASTYVAAQCCSSSTRNVTYSINFGNAPFTISSGNSDANGYGNFEYAVPSGYYALNTKNLSEFG